MICICFAIVIQDAVRWAPRVNVQAVVLQKNEKTKNGSRQQPSLPVDEILALKWFELPGDKIKIMIMRALSDVFCSIKFVSYMIALSFKCQCFK